MVIEETASRVSRTSPIAEGSQIQATRIVHEQNTTGSPCKATRTLLHTFETSRNRGNNGIDAIRRDGQQTREPKDGAIRHGLFLRLQSEQHTAITCDGIVIERLMLHPRLRTRTGVPSRHSTRKHVNASNGPSHDYNLYRQQVGLPTGSMANMPQQSMFDGYGPGIGDMGLDSGMTGWSSGIDMDSEMNMDFNNPQSAMPAMFFPSPNNDNHADNFVNPNTLGGQEDTTSSVGRLWPGMHSQQAQHAAMQKAAQAHAVQQRQMKLQAQHAQYRQAAASNSNSQSQGSSQNSQGHSKRPSHASEPHVEESISRLLNQMRQNSAVSANDDDDDDQGNMLPHIARMKKDEEEMDEDERLLASEEGKKLASKERRQLRNKVSARAFRSRRKGFELSQHSKMTTRSMLTKGAEYIGQLEGEVALKAQEANTLRNENSALMQENERYRGLIETLLRHPAFTPFINDISKDPSVLGVPQQHQSQHQEQQHQPSMTPTPQHPQPQQQQQQAPQQDSKPDFMNFDASQLQIPQQQHQQQQQSEQVGLAMIPENDFSKLNINGFNSMNFNNFHSVNAFAVTDGAERP